MPDEAHKKYFDESPNGNHDKPSRETLKMFMELENKISDTYITKGAFRWFFGVQMTVMILLVGALFGQIAEINKTTVNLRLDSVSIKSDIGYLKSEFDFKASKE